MIATLEYEAILAEHYAGNDIILFNGHLAFLLTRHRMTQNVVLVCQVSYFPESEQMAHCGF